MFFLKPFYIDLSMDLGTANTIVYATKKGFILNQASYVAVNRGKQQIVALGNNAKEMLGKTGASINVSRPLAGGVIADFDAGDAMVRGFIKAAQISRFRIGKVLMGVPTNANEVEKRAMVASARSAGAKEVYLVAEPMAAAIGAGLDVKDRNANLIVDIGGGTTDIAVINYGGIIVDNTVKVAGDDINLAIIHYLQKEYNIKIGESTAEKLKMKMASSAKKTEQENFTFSTINHVTGSAKEIVLSVHDFRKCFSEVVENIVSAILYVLEVLPPELSSDIIDRGILITGGGALVDGLNDLIREKTNLHVTMVENPLYTVALGTRAIISNFKYYQDILINYHAF